MGSFGTVPNLGKIVVNVRRSAQVVKGEDCKSFMQRFESALRLQSSPVDSIQGSSEQDHGNTLPAFCRLTITERLH